MSWPRARASSARSRSSVISRAAEPLSVDTFANQPIALRRRPGRPRRHAAVASPPKPLCPKRHSRSVLPVAVRLRRCASRLSQHRAGRAWPSPWRPTNRRPGQGRRYALAEKRREPAPSAPTRGHGRPLHPDSAARYPACTPPRQALSRRRSLGGLHRLLDRAHYGVIGPKYPVVHRETIAPADNTDCLPRCCFGPSRPHRGGLPPSGTVQPPPSNTAPRQRDRQRRSHTEAGAFGGVAVSQVDDGLRPPQDLAEFTCVDQLANIMNANPRVGVGSPIDSSSAICSDATCDASRTRPWILTPHQSGHADRQRELVPSRAHNWPSSSKWSALFVSTCQPVAHSMVRGEMRIEFGWGRRRAARRRSGVPAPN